MPDDYYDDRGPRRDERWDDRRDDRRRDDYIDDRDRGRRPPPPRDDYDRGRGPPPPRDDYRRPPPRPGRYPWIMPMIMLIIVIVLLGIALATPWWHGEVKTETDSEYSGSGTSLMSADYKTGEVDVKLEYSGDAYDSEYYEDEEETLDWDEVKNMEGDKTGNMEDTFGLTGTLTIVAMVLAIVALVFVIICGLRFLPLKIATILCLVTLLIALIAPIYFAAAIGDACKKDDYPGKDGKIELGDKKLGPIAFITSDKTSSDDEYSKTTIELTSYPTIAWILAIVAIIFAAIALFQVNRLKRKIGPPMYGAPRGPPRRDYPPPRGPPRDDYDRSPPPRREPPRDDYDRGPPPRDDYDYDRRPPPRREPRDDW